MGKKLHNSLRFMILFYFIVSLTVGSVSAAFDPTNSTALSNSTADLISTLSNTSDTGVDNTAISDLIKNYTPKDPNISYIAIIDIATVEIEIDLKHIVVAYISAADMKDGKITASYLAHLANAYSNSNSADLSSLGISPTDLIGDTNTISQITVIPVSSDLVTSDTKDTGSSNTGNSNTGNSNAGNSNDGSCKSSTCKPKTDTTDKSSTTGKQITDSKKSTCKPATSTKTASCSKTSSKEKPAVSKTSTCKPTVSKTSTCKPTTSKTETSKPSASKTSTCKNKTTSDKPVTNNKESTCKSTSSNKPSTSNKATKESTSKH